MKSPTWRGRLTLVCRKMQNDGDWPQEPGDVAFIAHERPLDLGPNTTEAGVLSAWAPSMVRSEVAGHSRRFGGGAVRTKAIASARFQRRDKVTGNGCGLDVGKWKPRGDWELRLSMRSFWKHYRAKAKPWIIGHIPAWIDTGKSDALRGTDPYESCKDANLLHKALRLAVEPGFGVALFCAATIVFCFAGVAPGDFELWHRGKIDRENGGGDEQMATPPGEHGAPASQGGFFEPTTSMATSRIPCARIRYGRFCD